MSRNNQITVPSEFRNAIGIREGDIIWITPLRVVDESGEQKYQAEEANIIDTNVELTDILDESPNVNNF